MNRHVSVCQSQQWYKLKKSNKSLNASSRNMEQRKEQGRVCGVAKQSTPERRLRNKYNNRFSRYDRSEKCSITTHE